MADGERNITTSAIRRLKKELELIMSGSEQGISAKLVVSETGGELINQWDVYIDGQKGTSGYRLHARMTFPAQYPYQSPSFKFISPILHPNVYKDGRVCISILHTDQDEAIDKDIANCTWTPGLNVMTVCKSIISLLNEPYIYSPANIEASNLFRVNKGLYEETVRKILESGCEKI